MSFLDRLRAEAATRIQSIPGVSTAGQVASVALSVAGMSQQVRGSIVSDVLAPLSSKNLSLGLLSEAVYNQDPTSLIQGTGAARLYEEARAIERRAQDFVKPFTKQKSAGTEPIPHGLGVSRLWGGVTFDEYRKNFVRAASVKHSWKNLFHVQIAERTPVDESAFLSEGFINMLALDVSLTPYTLPGESVPIGSANMDRLASSERVEIRMTTMDDERGSIKRWFMSKCAQATHKYGTFGLPSDYLMTLTLTHMASARTELSDPRLSQRWLVRPANIDLELSRRAPELEELPLSFVEFDTFMDA